MKKYNFSVLIEKDEDGCFIAHVPELIGCHSYGDTMTELMANVREAISVCLESYEKDNVQVFNKNYVQTHNLEMVCG